MLDQAFGVHKIEDESDFKRCKGVGVGPKWSLVTACTHAMSFNLIFAFAWLSLIEFSSESCALVI